MGQFIVIYIDDDLDDVPLEEIVTERVREGRYEMSPGWSVGALEAARVAVKRSLLLRHRGTAGTRNHLRRAYSVLAATEKALTGRSPSTRAEP